MPPSVQSYLHSFLSWPACMHPYYVILTFRSVGLGSYLRVHVCHSYPGPLYCVVSQSISLSSIILLSPIISLSTIISLFNVVVRSSWSLVSSSIINVVPNNLFPLSVVMSGEDVVSRPSSDSTQSSK